MNMSSECELLQLPSSHRDLLKKSIVRVSFFLLHRVGFIEVSISCDILIFHRAIGDKNYMRVVFHSVVHI